ncbi:hypothetical protein KJ761_02740 [Patescibacteria group bacterium]|nr:hypothetical protein [Patescibacteria group bacterium]
MSKARLEAVVKELRRGKYSFREYRIAAGNKLPQIVSRTNGYIIFHPGSGQARITTYPFERIIDLSPENSIVMPFREKFLLIVEAISDIHCTIIFEEISK